MISDLDEQRVGSSGAMLSCVKYVAKHENSFKGKVLGVHSSEHSKRVLHYYMCYKLFIPVPSVLIDVFVLYKFYRYGIKGKKYIDTPLKYYFTDVGVVEYHHRSLEGKKVRTQLEVEFVTNKGSERYYIQLVLSVPDDEKREQEINSLVRVADSFKKIVVVRDSIMLWYDDQGILYIRIEDFIVDVNTMDL